MSDKINDGGPAFPAAQIHQNIGKIIRNSGWINPGSSQPPIAGGLTLRDYFAAKAMQAMIGCYRDTLRASQDELESGNGTDYTTFNRGLSIDENGVNGEHEGADEIGSDAYIFADAMLKAREAK